MKSFLKIIVCAAIAITLLCVGVNATAMEGRALDPTYADLLITEGEDGFALYRYEAGIPVALGESESVGALLSQCDGARVTLDSLHLTEPLAISRTCVILCGDLTTDFPITVEQGASVVFDSLTVNTASHVRVKGGELSVCKSIINAQSESAVIVDYSSASRFDLDSGTLSSRSEAPTVDLVCGIACISGGSITNEIGCAIGSAATLVLSGSPNIRGAKYDVSSSAPISLSRAGVAFCAQLSLFWQGSFEKGGMYEIVRDASAESASGVRVYDRLGREYPLSYFENSEHTDERCFGAVYLPYTLSFYDGTVRIGTGYYLSGETPKPISAPEHLGYTFDGWYADEGAECDYTFADPIGSDLEIFASYILNAPQFSLSSLSFTYGEGEKHLYLSELSHPLSDEGYFTLEWYKGDEYLGVRERVGISGVADSGEYSCRITFRHGKSAVSVTTPQVTVSVLKQSVPIPEISPSEYNGTRQYSGIVSCALYTVSDAGGIDVGAYYAELSLRDPENYTFVGGGSVARAAYVITQCDNRWTDTPHIRDAYFLAQLRHSAYSLYGTPQFLYSQSASGPYTEEVPKEVGVYYCTVRVEGTENYRELTCEPIAFRIIAEEAVAISVENMPSKTHYLAFERFSPVGMSVRITYNSGRSESVGADKLSIRYQSAEHLLYGDNAVTVSYLSLDLFVPVTVEKREYDISGIKFLSNTVVYNGSYQTLSYAGALPVGIDGIPLTASVSGGAVNAGEYTVTLSFSTESRNYKAPESMSAVLNITPLDVQIVWGRLTFIYDGTPKIPDGYYINALGSKIAVSAAGATVNAREGATATATSTDPNYRFSNPTVTYTVLKADISFAGAVWSADKFDYDGGVKSVSVRGLPDGVSVIGYTDNTATDAGVYTATALISYDERNYNPPPSLTHRWQIERISYDLGGFSFADATFVYDGAPHAPIMTGRMPTGLDGIELKYEFSTLPTDVTDGSARVEIRFYSESRNYLTPEAIYANVMITPMPISIEWSYTPVSYDGRTHVPVASSPYTAIKVSGAAVNAGTYTATASSVSKNYTVINPDYVFSISRAKNSWIVPPSVSDIFESETPSPNASVYGATVQYLYFRDPECSVQAELPLSHGTYYLLAFAPESENYLSITSEIIEFEVIKVVPTTIEVLLLNSDLTAFEKIGASDLRVTVGYNDGSTENPDFSSLLITYESADSLRAKDTSLTVAYLNVNTQIGIRVERADYDLSYVVWQNTVCVYDGTDKLPTVTGLPSGVSVLRYEGYGSRAGRYTVTAHLSYDAENYNAPGAVSTEMEIMRRPLTAPSLSPVEYDAQRHFPELDPELFLTDFSGAVDSGEYLVEIRLADPENYVIEGGADTATVLMLIEPRVITLEVVPPVVYLLQSVGMPAYSVVGGTTAASQKLMLDFSVDGDTVRIYSLDPNYAIEGGAVEIQRIGRLSPSLIRTLTAIFCAAAIIVLLSLALYLNRERIKDTLAAIRCKRTFVREAKIKSIDEIARTADVGSESVFSVDAERADSLISDDLAKSLVKRERETVYTSGRRKTAVNVSAISDAFSAGECVDVNALKARGVVPADTARIKVLAGGTIDKQLSVKANAFSLSAVKMIALSGGEAIKVISAPIPKSQSTENG